MKVGDLVVQLGWEADGAGIVTKIWTVIGYSDSEQSYAAVLWPGGACEMNWNQLEGISESR